ncbi:DUF3830 family protein [Evansella sp. AB-rgal1]|uniref:DUF3830 family protein n=1 Tax=Evansella sp. AB-rgal1 TaxID=3242696 RepID=UPI00359CEC65
MKYFLIEFPEEGKEFKVELLTEKAPKTCEAFWEAISEPVEVFGKHAMYTGKEVSVQLPPNDKNKGLLYNAAPENLTCFPLPGELLFTFMPEHAFGGIPVPIYDVGIFYGRDARTFFPMGWLPGNLFAQLTSEEDKKELAEIGKNINVNGQQKIIFRRG